MEKFWALDYVDEYECELVVDAQLYATEEAALEARAQKKHPERYDITWYLKKDLEDDVFGCEICITPELKIEITER